VTLVNDASRALDDLQRHSRTHGNAQRELSAPLKQLRNAQRDLVPPVVRVQTALHPYVAYGVMPLFALANAGVRLDGVDVAASQPRGVLLGVLLGLVLGKPIGICAATWLAVSSRLCRLPPSLSWRGIVLVGSLGGIGFTMSIFIATLAFPG